MDKRSEDSTNYGAPRVPSDCHFSANFGNSAMGDLAINPPSFLSSMMDSFAPSFWENPANLQPSEFNSIRAHSASSTLDKLGLIKGPGSLMATGFEAGWGGPDSMLKGGILLPAGPGAIPHNLPQFPADSAFIERAARFSCFSNGNAADVANPFGMSQHVHPYHQAAMMQQDRHHVYGGELQNCEVNPPSTSKEGSPRKSEEKNCENDDGVKQAGSDKEPSLVSLDTDAERSSATELCSKKRKRGGQQSCEDDKDDGKQNCSAPTTNKATGKNAKQSSQLSDSSKEGYIHVRARRGQATNSHSLAERVRREKISERMKFLQDLVPGCSKVTGKAVMLDEIINYVQSLQRQVEFLSMKLATVNPRLDCNFESLLAKDLMFGTRGGPLLGFSPNIPILYPPLHPSQSATIQPGLPLIGGSSDALGNANSQLTSIGEGYKKPTPQMHNLWDDELHNVIQMGFNPNTSPDNQDTSSSLPPGHMKVEP